VADPGLIGVGTRVMPMGRLVLRLTMLKTCLNREGSYVGQSCGPCSSNELLNEDMIR